MKELGHSVVCQLRIKITFNDGKDSTMEATYFGVASVKEGAQCQAWGAMAFDCFHRSLVNRIAKIEPMSTEYFKNPVS